MVCVTTVTWFSGSSVFITPGRHFSDEPHFWHIHRIKQLKSRACAEGGGKDFGRVERWSTFPTSNVYKPIIPLAAGHQNAMGCDFCLSGWRGGAYPELDYIKTNNITWYSPPPPNMPFIYTQCWESGPPLQI